MIPRDFTAELFFVLVTVLSAESASAEIAMPELPLRFGLASVSPDGNLTVKQIRFVVEQKQVAYVVEVPVTVTKLVDGAEQAVTEYRAEQRTKVAP